MTGLLHLGFHDGQPHIQGALIYRDNDHHNDHYGYHHYDYGHYYHHYSPFYTHYDYGHHYPRYGYSYSSVYYQHPVVYRFYNTQTIYVDDGNDRDVRYTDSFYDNNVDNSTLMGPPAPRTGVTDRRPGVSNTSNDYAVIKDQLNGHPVKQGSIAYARGDYEEAGKFFVQAMLSDERDGYAKLLYSMTSFATGDYDVAAVALRRALLTTDLLIDRPLDIRTLYQDLHQFDVQIDRLKHYVTKHPKDRESRFLLGYINYATGRQKPAVAIFGTLSLENHDDILVSKLLKAAALSKPSTRGL